MFLKKNLIFFVFLNLVAKRIKYYGVNTVEIKYFCMERLTP